MQRLKAAGFGGGMIATFVGLALMAASILPADAMATTSCPRGTGNDEFLEGQYSETSLRLSSNSYGSGGFGLAQCETVNTRTLEYTIPAEDFAFYQSLWHMTTFEPWNWWFTVLGPTTGKLEPVFSGESLEGYRSTLNVNVSLTLHAGNNTCKASPIALEMTTGKSGSLEGTLFKGSLSTKLEGKLVANTFSVPTFKESSTCSNALALTLNRRGSLPAPAGQATLSIGHIWLFPYGTLPANSGAPSISGLATEGNTLSATAGSWTGSEPITYRYQWERCTATGSECARVNGAEGTTYVVGYEDVGHKLRAAVTASNAAGETTAYSEVTAVAETPTNQRAFSSSSPFNKPIAEGATKAANSEELVNQLRKSVAHPSENDPHGAYAELYEYGSPVWNAVAGTSTFHVPVNTEECGPVNFEADLVPIPPNASPSFGTDHSMIVIDHSSHYAYDFFKAVHSGSSWTAECGTRFEYSGNGAPGHGATGSGMPLLAGLVRSWEVEQGEINHALIFSSHWTRREVGGECAPCYHYPAFKTDGHELGKQYIEEGTRVRLNPNAPLEESKMRKGEVLVAKALKKYGAYVNNSGGSDIGIGFEEWGPEAEHKESSNPEKLNASNPYETIGGWEYDYGSMPHIPWNELEVLSSCYCE